MKLLLFPRFMNREQLIDELSRSIWYYEPIRENTNCIHILYGGDGFTQDDLEALLSDFKPHLKEHFDPVIAEWAEKWKGKFNLIQDPDGKIEESWSEKTSGVMVWGPMDSDVWDRLTSIGDRVGLFYTHGCVNTQMNEAANRNLFTRKLLTEEKTAHNRTKSLRGLQVLSDRIDNREVYVYGSAPSVSQLIEAEYDFGDGEHIVCNSLVKNTELMEILKPKIIICGDPVFHGGPSRYAAEFRRTLKEFMQRYDSYLITPTDYVPNLETALEEKLHDRVIGVSLSADIDININLLEEMTAYSTENILTLLLLPVAFTVSKNVSILGCDGRSFVHDEYFWSHDKKSQFGDLMEETKIVHPKFFDRDFNAYYLAHCEMLERMLQTGEENGRRTRMITPSYIPPLAKRYEAVI